MSETLPDGVSVSDIGFHEEYDRDCWRTDGGRRLAFERVIEPDERVLTVYFIRDDTMDPSAFENPPSIEEVHAMDDGEVPESAPLFRGASAETDTPIDDAVIVNADVSDVEAARSRAGADPESIDLDPPSAVDRPLADGDDQDEGDGDGFTEASPDEPLRLNDPDGTLDDEAGTEDDGFHEASPDVPLELNDPAEPTTADSAGEDPSDPGSQPESGIEDTAADRTDVDIETVADGAQPAEPADPPSDRPSPSTAREPNDPEIESSDRDDDLEALVDDRVAEHVSGVLEARIERIVEEQLAAAVQEHVESIDSTVADAVERKLDDILEARVDDVVDDRLESVDVETAETPSEPVAERFAAELRDGVDASTVEVLRDRLSSGPPNHLEARIKRVEGEINELAAYTDALREFLDENGPARALLEGLDDRVATLESRSESIAATNDQFDERLDSLESNLERIDGVAEEVDALARRIDRHESRIESGSTAVQSLEATVDSLTDRIDELAGRNETLAARNERIVDVFETLATELSESPTDDPAAVDSTSDETSDR